MWKRLPFLFLSLPVAFAFAFSPRAPFPIIYFTTTITYVYLHTPTRGSVQGVQGVNRDWILMLIILQSPSQTFPFSPAYFPHPASHVCLAGWHIPI